MISGDFLRNWVNSSGVESTLVKVSTTSMNGNVKACWIGLQAFVFREGITVRVAPLHRWLLETNPS